MTDLETLVGAEHIGPEQPYTIAGWRLRATVTDQLPTGEPAPTVVPWPVTSVPLASVGECIAVTDPATVTQVTDTTDEGEPAHVLHRGRDHVSGPGAPLLPDETGC